MIFKKIVLRPPVIALIILAIISIDLFLMPKHEIIEVLDDGTIAQSRTSITHSYETFFLISKGGNRYKVHENIYNSITVGDRFAVYKTFFFRRNAAIAWCMDGKCYKQKIGTFNSDYFSIALMIGLFIANLLLVFNVLKQSATRSFIFLGLAIGVFIFYLVY